MDASRSGPSGWWVLVAPQRYGQHAWHTTTATTLTKWTNGCPSMPSQMPTFVTNGLTFAGTAGTIVGSHPASASKSGPCNSGTRDIGEPAPMRRRTRPWPLSRGRPTRIFCVMFQAHAPCLPTVLAITRPICASLRAPRAPSSARPVTQPQESRSRWSAVP